MTPSPIDSLECGQVFGQYRIIRLLGRGGMGEVYEVAHTTLDSHYALKIIQSEIMRMPDALERFKREARAMHKLQHPNILQVDDFGELDGRTYLRMELANGCQTQDGQTFISLQDAIRAYVGEKADLDNAVTRMPGQTSAPLGPGRVPEPIARKWILELLSGLDHAHTFPTGSVIHRDIKPANLLFKDNTLKISDFGLVHLAGDQWLQTQMQKSLTMMAVRRQRIDDAETVLQSGSGSGARSSSASAAIMGTFEYMSPECRAGQVSADARSDLYAVGKIAFQMLTGEGEIGRRSMLHFAPDIDPAWDDWVDKALESRISERFQTAREMIESLPGGEDRKPIEISRHASEAPAARKSGGFPILALILLPLLILSGAAAFFYWQTMEASNAGKADTAETETKTVAASAETNTPDQLQPITLVDEAAIPQPVLEEESAQEPAVVIEPELPPAFEIVLMPEAADARIWIGKFSNHPITSGTTRLEGIAPGRQRVRIDAPGFQPFNAFVRVEDDSSGTLDVELVPVTGEMLAEAEPGTTVTAIAADGREIELGVTGDNSLLTVEELLSIGTYDIRFTKANYETVVVEGIDLNLLETPSVRADMKPLPGQLNIFSFPRGAEIFIDGDLSGSTPTTIDGIPSLVETTVEIRKRGYRRMQQTVTLDPAGSRDIDFGRLAVESGDITVSVLNSSLRNPEMLTMRLDGEVEPIDTTRIFAGILLPDLELGSKTIEISHPDYETATVEVTVIDSENVDAQIRLQPLPGVLTLTIEPERIVGRATLEVQGREPVSLSSAVTEHTLPAETDLRITVSAPGFETAETVAELPANSRASWTASLRFLPPPTNKPYIASLPGRVSMEFLPIAPGRFAMGSPISDESRDDDESQFTATLTKTYWLGRYETTQRQFQALMGYNPSAFTDAGPDAPVEMVSWDSAMMFCQVLTRHELENGRIPANFVFTLPSEAEWEYACRADTVTPFSFGADPDDLHRFANYCDAENTNNFAWQDRFNEDGFDKTAPVGSLRPNPWGFHDMHGNVWEWTADIYGPYPRRATVDPRGPDVGLDRVSRGGCWGNDAKFLRSAERRQDRSGSTFNYLGFRVALKKID